MWLFSFQWTRPVCFVLLVPATMATSDNALLIVVAILPCSKFKGNLFWKVLVSVLLVFDRNKSNCDLSETQYYNIMSGGCFKKL